ncbi:Lrp/AsnC family transcriptional regulator [Candidatus Pelagibacter bacterium]|nr:Lrp/AsnC family transcriptional regulator [Candidatus Pelagibacter bacterium]
MKTLPNISAQIDEYKISEIIDKNFSKLAPFFYPFITNWLTRAYSVYGNIDKYLITIYLINRQFIFYRKNGIIVNFDTFFENKPVEIDKINISDISKDIKIPKESVRRKIQELEDKEIIKRVKKRILIYRSGLSTDRVNIAIKELSLLLYEFNKILKDEREVDNVFEIEEIISSIKQNYSFSWYQFYKFLFNYTNRWKAQINDLETLCIGMTVVLSATQSKQSAPSKKNRTTYFKEIMGSDLRGVNAMSLSDITGIPRPTVVRKLKWLIDNNFLTINDKKLIFLDAKESAFTQTKEMQKQNFLSLSNFIYRLFNQIKVINS